MFAGEYSAVIKEYADMNIYGTSQYLQEDVVLELRDSDKLSIFGANILYMIVMILFVTVGYFVQKRSFHYGILITEFLLIALPAIIYAKIKGTSIKEEFRLNRIGLVDVLLIIVAFLSSYFVAVFINLIAQILISTAGNLILPDIPFAENPREYLTLLLIIAGSAGICEEILFRGILLRAYERFGMWRGIIISALFFSVLHLNIQNMAAPFFLGIVLGFVVYKTNSIFAGILGHFINNAISVTFGYVVMNMPFYKNISNLQIQEGMTTPSLIGAAVLFGAIVPFTGAIMVLCLKALNDRHPEAAASGSDAVALGLLKDIKISWPLLISLIIFVGMMALEIMFIMRG